MAGIAIKTQPRVESVTLTLDEDEALYVLAVLGKGNQRKTYRAVGRPEPDFHDVVYDQLWDALKDAGLLGERSRAMIRAAGNHVRSTC